MIGTRSLCILAILVVACSSDSQEDPIPGEDPAPKMEDTDPTDGLTLAHLTNGREAALLPLGGHWKFLDTHTDEFEYTGKNEAFEKNWNDTYFNSWLGPGLTEWNSDHSDVQDGKLIIKASRKPDTEKVFCGVISSKELIKYPIYSEVMAKPSNQVLSSNFWFLSPDDEREIDVLEIYGGDRPDQTWFAARPSTNTHVFIRGENNEILEDINNQHHHVLPNEEPWRNDFHRFGVYWKDSFTLDFYYDGQLVSEVREARINDPEGLGIDRDMYMVIDTEDHEWRSFPTNGNPLVRATDEELSDETKNKYFVEYVRTFRPLEAYDGGLIKNGSFNDLELGHWYWKGPISIDNAVKDNERELYAAKIGPGASIVQKVDVSKNTDYRLEWSVRNVGGSQAVVAIHGISEKDIVSSGNWERDGMAFNSGERIVVYVMIENKGSSDIVLDLVKLDVL